MCTGQTAVRRMPSFGQMPKTRSMTGMDKRGDRRPDKRRPWRDHEFVKLQDAAQWSKRERERRDQIKQQKAEQRGEKTRCECCGGPLRACGAVGRAGHLRWKCRKCGSTVWVRPDFKPPVPIVPVGVARMGSVVWASGHGGADGGRSCANSSSARAATKRP